MSKIYLARHGQDEDNAAGILNGQRDTPLTQLGVEQAEVLAQKIKDLNLTIEKIYSSPLKRAYKTAEKVADVLSLPKPEKIDLLIERNFGVMTGKFVSDIEILCSPDIIKSTPITYFLSPEGSETFPQLIDRAKKFLSRLKENNHDENIGKMMYTAFYDLDWKDTLTRFHFGNSEVLLLVENSTEDERYVHKVIQHNH
jgi:broad specificity phosphatase PhoE